MDAFRSQGLKSAIYGAAVVAIGFVFVTQFKPAWLSQGPQGPKVECAAEVRGECISNRDFKATLALAARGADEGFLRQSQLRKHVMDGLVERNLLSQDADRLGITISDDDLNAALTSGQALFSLGVDSPEMLRMQLGLGERSMRILSVKGPNGEFDRKTYGKSLKMMVGRGEQEFREMQKLEHLAARMREIVQARVRVSDEEAYAAFDRYKSTASIKYVLFPRQWVAAHAVTQSKEAVAAWADAHKAEVDASWEQRKNQFLPECRKARHILVKVDPTATEEEKSAARKKIDDVKARLKKGDAFEDVARETSDDSTASNGGDLGCVEKGKTVKPFEDSVFSLEAGKTSDVIETQFGFHLIKLDAILKDKDAEAEGRREIALDRMLATEAEAKGAEAAKRVQAALASGKTIEEATADVVAGLVAGKKATPSKKKKSDDKEAKKEEPKKADDDEVKPEVKEKKDFTANDTPITGILQPDVAALAFSLKKTGDTTPDVIKTDQGYLVIQLTDRKPASRSEFEKDKIKYAGGMQQAKQRDALVSYVARLKAQSQAEIKIRQEYITDKQAPADDSGE